MRTHFIDTPFTLGADSVGCLLESSRGQAHNDHALILLAELRGFEVTGWPGADGGDVNGQATPSWGDWNAEERMAYRHLDEVAEEALTWLNDTFVDEGYVLEWVDGDLFLFGPARESAYGTVRIDAGYSDAADMPLCMGDGIESVRIALPGEDGLDTPTQFDWLNSITVDFHVDSDGQEDVNVYISTGDPRGAMRVVNISRGEDGSILLRMAQHDEVTRHEHYAKPVESSGRMSGDIAWKIR